MVWELGGGVVEQVESYKYLGLDLKGNLSWGMYKSRLIGKARKNMVSSWSMGIQSGLMSVGAAIGVWKALVRPVLEYGVEVWGDEKWEEAEKIQREMGRRIMGVKSFTNNEVVLGDLGWWRMKARRDLLKLKFWWKLLKMKSDRFTRLVYAWDSTSKLERSWSSRIEALLQGLGLHEYWKSQETGMNIKEWETLVRAKIQEREQKVWWNKVLESRKLRTYRLVKNELKMEEYLGNEDDKGRREMAKVRSGTSDLRIETGRHLQEKQKVEERRCWFGCGVVEDEKHFLLERTMDDDIRKETVEELGQAKYESRGLDILLGKGNMEEIKIGATYIKRAIARRERVLKFVN